MAPLQGATQRLVSSDRDGSPGEQGQGITQPVNDFFRFENGCPGRCQLEGQGHAVEPSAEVDHPLGVADVERKTRSDLRRSFDEEPHTRQVAELAEVRRAVPLG